MLKIHLKIFFYWLLICHVYESKAWFPIVENQGLHSCAKADTVRHLYEIEGVFLSAKDKRPVEGVEVTIVNRRNNHFQVIHTGTDGKFLFELHDQSVYVVMGRKPYFFDSKQVNISTIGRNEDDRISLSMPIKRMEMNVLYRINVAFAINDYRLYSEMTSDLDYLYQVLLKNPGLVVEIGVHTDARGNDEYNLKLSQERAASIAEYFSFHGIDKKRVISKGYGEGRLVNNCGNGVRCSSKAHEQNRRVEFRILRFN